MADAEARTAAAQDAVSTVRSFNELLLSGRLEEACSLLADDLVVHEPQELPYGGEFHGPSGLLELFTREMAVVDAAPVTSEYHDAGDQVVFRARARFAAKDSGESVEVDVVEIHTVRDGRIVDLDVYYKDPAAVAALAPKAGGTQ
jgi:ketosteroid isomerase-like protein